MRKLLLLLLIIPFLSFGQDAGCTDWYACNYDSTATVDDGSCEYLVNEYGECDDDGCFCIDPNACNYYNMITDLGPSLCNLGETEECRYAGDVGCYMIDDWSGQAMTTVMDNYFWNEDCECVLSSCFDETACNYAPDPVGVVIWFSYAAEFLTTYIGLECAQPGASCLWINENLYPEYEIFYDGLSSNSPEDAILYSGVYNNDCECVCNITSPVPIFYFDDNYQLYTDTISSCSESVSIIESKKPKSLLTTLDVLGKETNNKEGFQLHIYDDGSVEKKYVIK